MFETNGARWMSAALVALTLSMQSTYAEDVGKSAFTMTAISNVAMGEKVVAGEYDAVIARLASPAGRSVEAYSRYTNLCVAYTKSGELDAAEESCEKAVTIAGRRHSLIPTYSFRSGRRDKAVALSNRGVLRAVKGNVLGAERDFHEATNLTAALEAPRVNLDHLRNGVAQTARLSNAEK